MKTLAGAVLGFVIWLLIVSVISYFFFGEFDAFIVWLGEAFLMITLFGAVVGMAVWIESK